MFMHGEYNYFCSMKLHKRCKYNVYNSNFFTVPVKLIRSVILTDASVFEEQQRPL